jgi:hypothetical protein
MLQGIFFIYTKSNIPETDVVLKQITFFNGSSTKCSFLGAADYGEFNWVP